MYKNGDTGMIDVLLGSIDISELISNFEMIRKIYTNDLQVLKNLKIQYETISEQMNILISLKEQLELQRTENRKQRMN